MKSLVHDLTGGSDLLGLAACAEPASGQLGEALANDLYRETVRHYREKKLQPHHYQQTQGN